jgi:hypothetical protein
MYPPPQRLCWLCGAVHAALLERGAVQRHGPRVRDAAQLHAARPAAGVGGGGIIRLVVHI